MASSSVPPSLNRTPSVRIDTPRTDYLRWLNSRVSPCRFGQQAKYLFTSQPVEQLTGCIQRNACPIGPEETHSMLEADRCVRYTLRDIEECLGSVFQTRGRSDFQAR